MSWWISRIAFSLTSVRVVARSRTKSYARKASSKERRTTGSRSAMTFSQAATPRATVIVKPRSTSYRPSIAPVSIAAALVANSTARDSASLSGRARSSSITDA